MQPAAGVAVHVGHVLDRRRPQRRQVEPRVARDQRVEGPVDPLDPHGQEPLALVQLEPPSQPASTRLGPDGEHVGPVRRDAVAYAADAEDEPDETPGVERAGGHAADLLRDHQDRGRHHIHKVPAPDVPLQGNTRLVLRTRLERSNGDLIVGHDGKNTLEAEARSQRPGWIGVPRYRVSASETGPVR